MRAVLTLAFKDLLVLWRDKFALFWILAFPLMFALFFGAIFGGESGGGKALTITVVDEDGSAASAALVARLADHASVTIPRIAAAPAPGQNADTTPGASDSPDSPDSPDASDASDASDSDAAPSSAPLEALTLDEARLAVQKGRRAAYLRIPKGFGDNPYAIFGGGDAGQAPLEIGIDPGRRAEAGFLQGVLMESIFGALQDRFLDKDLVQGDLSQVRAEVAAADDISPGQKLVFTSFFGALSVFIDQLDLDAMGANADDADGAGTNGASGGMGAAVTVVDVSRDRSNLPRSTWDITFPQSLVWGLMSVAMGFAITFARERTAGTLLRLRIAPVSRNHLLAGKAVGCFLACLATMTILLAFGSLALGVRFDSLPLLLVAMLCTAACFTGLMMTISVMGRTEAAVAGGSWGLLMPFAMIGGGMIPLMAMPDWLATLSMISPFKWAITAIEGAVWRGYTPADMALPCAILVGTGAAFFALGMTIFRRVEA